MTFSEPGIIMHGQLGSTAKFLLNQTVLIQLCFVWGPMIYSVPIYSSAFIYVQICIVLIGVIIISEFDI